MLSFSSFAFSMKERARSFIFILGLTFAATLSTASYAENDKNNRQTEHQESDRQNSQNRNNNKGGNQQAEPLDCSAAYADPSGLWPVNHKFVEIDIRGITGGQSNNLEVITHCIVQDEPLDTPDDHSDGSNGGSGSQCNWGEGVSHSNNSYAFYKSSGKGNHKKDNNHYFTPQSFSWNKSFNHHTYGYNPHYSNNGHSNGDGNTEVDAIGIGTENPQVRAERQGGGDGRVYHLLFTATDNTGAMCAGEVSVGVAHSKKGTAIDSGSRYISGEGATDCDGITINNPPVITSSPLTTILEGDSYNYQVVATDADNDALEYLLFNAPTGMQIDVNTGEITWISEYGTTGSYDIELSVSDGTDTDSQTYTLLVEKLNTAPTTEDLNLNVLEGENVSMTLVALDNEGDVLTVSYPTLPAHGVLSGDFPNLTYTGSIDFYGSDQFTYQLNDGELDSEIATVSIDVIAVNDPPVALSQQFSTNEDTGFALTLTGSDIDTVALSYAITSQPTLGSLSGIPPSIFYTPDSNLNGLDSFSFIVNDGEYSSTAATIEIEVIAQSDAPVANSFDVELEEDTQIEVELSGSDADGDALSYQIIDSPEYGSLSGTAPDFIYSPNQDFTGTDTLTYLASDGGLDSELATVNIDVLPINDAPTAESFSVETSEDQEVILLLAGQDVDSETLSYEIIQSPEYGVLSGIAPELTYTANAEYNGVDSFTYRVLDGELESEDVLVEITVLSVNDTPVAETQSLITDEDTPLDLALNGTDIDGDNLTYEIQQFPTNGSLSGDIPNLIYTPDTNFNGVDSLIFLVNDGEANSALASVSFEILPVNDAPEITSLNLEIDEDTSISIQLSGFDVDGDPLSYEIVGFPEFGELSGVFPDLIYTPNTNFFGIDRLVYKVSDGEFESPQAEVQIMVEAVNDIPVVENLEFSIEEGEQLVSAFDGFDVEGDEISYQIIELPVHGQLTTNYSEFIYQADSGYVGTDQFTYIANDGRGSSLEATVVITINEQNIAPEIVSLPIVQAIEGELYAYSVIGQDQNSTDTINYSLDLAPGGAQINSVTGEISWIPSKNDSSIGFLETDQSCLNQEFASAENNLYTDTVFLMDESGSLDSQQEWLSRFSPIFDIYLRANHFGAEMDNNLYGLIGFGFTGAGIENAYVREFLLGEEEILLASIDDAVAAMEGLYARGGTEDGYAALQSALEYPFREDAIKQVVMITDESRSVSFGHLDLNTMIEGLQESGVIFHIAADVTLRCGDERPALGMDSNGTGYVLSDIGGYESCTDAYIAGGVGDEDYFPLVEASGGSIWAIDFMTQEGQVFDAFSRAYPEVVSIAAREFAITENQTDLAIESISHTEDIVNLTVRNRGLIDVSTSFNIAIIYDQDEIFTTEIDFLSAGESQSISHIHPGVIEGSLTAEISMNEGVIDECHTDNNSARTTAFRVRATDDQGLFDIQNFSVAVNQTNSPPEFSSTPIASAVLGTSYRYQAFAEDSDIGDSITYELISSLGDMRIDSSSGMVIYTPRAGDPITSTIEIIASDSMGASISQTYELSLDSSYELPSIISTAPFRAIEGTNYVYLPEVIFDSSTSIEFELYNAPEGLLIDETTGYISWQVPAGYAGMNHYFGLEVRDENDNYDMEVITLTGDRAPSPIAINQTEAELRYFVDQTYFHNVEWSDDNYFVTRNWEVNSVPDNASFFESGEFLIWDADTSAMNYGAIEGENYYCLNTAIQNFPYDSHVLWSSPNTIYQPQIGHLYDSNQDGILNEQDRKIAIGISSKQSVIAVDALTGESLWESTEAYALKSNMGAIVVSNNAQQALYVFPNINSELIALNADGSLHWISSDSAGPERFENNAVIPSDLDGDGRVEIVFGGSVFDIDGNLLWQFPMESYKDDHKYSQPYIIDLDKDGLNEVVFHREVRSHNGELLFELEPLLPDSNLLNKSLFSSGNFDSDPELELVAIHDTTGTKLSLIDDDGTEIWTVNTSNFGLPLVVDVDGDGENEIYSSGSKKLYSNQGAELWSANSQGEEGGSASIVDLDLDGSFDFFQYDDQDVLVIDGITGFEKWRYPIIDQLGNAPSSHPILVDLDEDGSSEIIFGGRYLKAISSSTDMWTAAPNGESFFGRAIHQTGLFQLAGEASDINTNVSMERGDQEDVIGYLPDLTIRTVIANPVGDLLLATVEVANEGLVDIPFGSKVQLYWDQLPVTESESEYVGELVLGDIAARSSSSYQISIPKNWDAKNLFAQVTLPEGVMECEINNNIALASTFSITLTDDDGSDSEIWAIGSVTANYPPVFENSSSFTTEVGQEFTLQIEALDSNVTDKVQYSLYSSSAGISIDSNTGLLKWIPQVNQIGSHTVQVVASDRFGASQTQNLNISVTGNVDETQISLTLPTDNFAAVNTLYQADIIASSVVEALFTFTLISGPEGMSLNALTGQIEWIPTLSQLGISDVNLSVSDTSGNTADAIFSIDVLDIPNNPPVIMSSPITYIEEGQNYEYLFNVSDNDPVSLSLVTAPASMIFNSDTGLLSWPAESVLEGVYPIVLQAQDSIGQIAVQSFDLEVEFIDPNTAPMITSNPNEDALLGDLYGYQVVAEDANNDPLSYQLLYYPSGMSIDSNGLIEWLPEIFIAPSIEVQVRVYDDQGLYADQTYQIALDPGINPEPPKLINNPLLDAYIGVIYQYEPIAKDYVNMNASISLVSAPAGMTFVEENDVRFLQWEPIIDQCFIPVTLLLTDQFGQTAEVIYDITVHSTPKKLNRFQCSLDDAACAATTENELGE